MAMLDTPLPLLFSLMHHMHDYNFHLAGTIMASLFSTWINAYYCFDYIWSLHGVPLAARKSSLQKYWMFFIGFGMPMTLFSSSRDWVAQAAFSSAIFPLGIILACGVNPATVHERGRS